MIWLPPGRRTTRPQQQFVLADQGLSLTRGLVGAYILNAHSGLTIRDAARKANGTATAGVTWVTGREGLVSSMDASTSEVAFAAATGGVPAFTATKPISGAFRWKCTSAGNLTIACQFSLNGSGGWVLRINGGVAGTLDLFVANANGTSGRQRNTSATFNDDKWHTGVFTYDGSNTVGGIHLYVDSPVEAAAATGLNTDPGAVTGGALSIGRLLGGAPQRFAGNLDFVFLWNRVLLSNEIAAILQNPWQVLAPTPKWPFVAVHLPAVHATTGALAGAGAVVAGASIHNRAHATTGALAGQGAALAGSARRFRTHAASGILAGQGANVAGAAARTRAHVAAGVLAGGGSAVAGAARRFRDHAAIGLLAGQGAALAADSLRFRAHAAAGALAGAGAAVAGTSIHNRAHAADGALIADGAVILAGAAVGQESISDGDAGQLIRWRRRGRR